MLPQLTPPRASSLEGVLNTALAAGSQPGAAQAEAPAIDVAGLVKRHPGRSSNALDGISFQVRRGGMFGLLGANGGLLGQP